MGKVELTFDVQTEDGQRALKDLAKQGAKTGKVLSKAAEKTSQTWSTLKGVLGANIIIGGFNKLTAAATSAFNTIADNTILVETLTTEMQTMTGSAEKAADVMDKLTTFAATTPFQLENIARAGKQLIAFGFEADTITDKLQAIGDVAAGSGAELSDVSLIFGQVAAAGKLTGERLLQFQERAIPIGPALAKTMGIAEESVKDFVSEGRVDFDTFEKAFKSLSEEGGIFFDSMIDKSETTAGVISTLKDNFNLFAADLGKEFLPVFKAISKALISFIQENKEAFSRDITSTLRDGLTKLLKVLPEVASWLNKALVVTVESARIAINALDGAIDTVGLAMATLAKLAISTQIGYLKLKGVFTDTTKELSEATATYNELDAAQQGFLNNLAETGESIENSFSKIGDAVTDSSTNSKLEKFSQTILENLAKIEKQSKDTKAELEKPINVNIQESLFDRVTNFFTDLPGTVKDSFTELGREASNAFQKASTFVFGGEVKPGGEAPSAGSETEAKKEDDLTTRLVKAAGKIGKALLSSLSAGTKSTRQGLDKIADIEDKMRRARAAGVDRESEEYRKLIEEKIAAEKELGMVQKQEAQKFFGQAAGAITDIFLPGAGQFVSQLLELAQDPEAFSAFIDGFVSALPEIISAIIDALPIIIDKIIQHLPAIVEALAEAVGPVAVALAEGVIKLIERIPDILVAAVRGLFDGIFDRYELRMEKLFEPLDKLIEKIKGLIPSFGGGGGVKIGGTLGQAGEEVKSWFGGANGGVVPPGFPNDSFPAALTSGEVVLNQDQQRALAVDNERTQNMLGELLATSQAPIQVSAELVLNENVFADIILTLNKDNRRLA